MDLQPLAPEGGVRAGHRVVGAYGARELLGLRFPLQRRVEGRDLRCEGRPVRRLRHRLQRPVVQPAQRMDEQRRAELGETLHELSRGLGGPDRDRLLGQDRSGVHALVEDEAGHPGAVVPGEQRVLHGCGAPPARQQREVQVHEPGPRDREDRRRQEGAVGDDGAGVEVECRELVTDVGGALRLPDVDARPLSLLLHRRGAQPSTTPARPVRVRDDDRDLDVVGSQQGPQRGHRRHGGSEEGDPHDPGSATRRVGRGPAGAGGSRARRRGCGASPPCGRDARGGR